MSTETNLEIPGQIRPLQNEPPRDPGRGGSTPLQMEPADLQAEPADLVRRNIQYSKTHALQAAGELKTAVEAKGRELLHVADELLHAADGKASEIKAKAESAYGEARNQVKVLQQHTEQYVRQNPLGSVCMALGAGFVLGLLARR